MTYATILTVKNYNSLYPILGTQTLQSGRQLIYQVAKPLLVYLSFDLLGLLHFNQSIWVQQHQNIMLYSEDETGDVTLVDLDSELQEFKK